MMLRELGLGAVPLHGQLSQVTATCIRKIVKAAAFQVTYTVHENNF